MNTHTSRPNTGLPKTLPHSVLPAFASHTNLDSAPVCERTATFDVDLALPGVQVLLLVVVEVQRELRRRYGIDEQKLAS
jgi:hypothetical protein